MMNGTVLSFQRMWIDSLEEIIIIIITNFKDQAQ
jgi:hypothetical protein